MDKKHPIEYEKILGINVCTFSYEELKKNIINDITNKQKSFIVAINPEKILKARENLKLKDILNNAKYPIPDGIGVVYASKLKKGRIKGRITGIDSMNMLLDLANQNSYKIFLYGAKEEIIFKTKLKLEETYSQIKIVGYQNGYVNNQSIITKINKAKPDILFVALGSPRQEEFIKNNMDILKCNIFQGVGGSFDVISGNIKRAPVWMQEIGLEWLYRLLKEPKRIFRQLKIINFIIIVIFSRKKKMKNV